MADRDALIAGLDELLRPSEFADYGPNGLQVPGADEVGVVVTGVSAHLELFERAADEGADLVLCHHGIFWGAGPGPITPQLKRRLQVLFAADMSLAAYHLPLDAHSEVGNNALLCAALGLERTTSFATHKGRDIGWVGRAREALSLGELARRCEAATGQAPLLFAGGPEEIRQVGIVTGAGTSFLPEAAELGLDAFITGEPSERAMADAHEAGLHYVAAGHYATETFGVRRLGDLLAERFEVEHRFIAVPNPV